MVYRVLANGIDILGSEPDSALLSPSLQTELNSAGSFEFTLPPDHPAYDDVKLMTTLIEIYEDGDLIFLGRPSEISIDWFNQKKVLCEGVLAYLNDTVVRPHVFEGALISDVFTHIINQHNSQVDQNRRFVIGTIDITDRYVYTDIGYDNCFSVLKSACIDSTGGYLFTRVGENDSIYIDWLKEMPYASDQPIQFASNLLDLTQQTKAEDICTVVLPLGGQIDGVDLTIADVNGGSDILEDADAIALYGRITKVMQWSDIIDAQSLKDKALDWLTDEQYDKLTIEVNAAELHYLDGSVGAYKVGQMVEVISGPHNITKEVPIIKMDISLDSGVKKVSLGTPPREELTELSSGMVGSGGYSGGSSGSGGGSSSSGVRDVLVNGSSVVSDHVARISMPTDVVTEGQMNTAISAAVAPKANTSDVNSALALKANTSDVAAALATKANLSDIINVVANPSGTATDELNSIQIGNDIYEIVGGGGGGESQKFEETLIFDTPTSSTGNITVSSMSDADELIFIIGIFADNEYQVFSNAVSMTELKKGERVFIGGTITTTDGTTYSKFASVKYVNDTTIAIVDIRGHSWAETGYLYRIYKRRYASNVISNHYLSDYYSEEERAVGRWTDGKPLYQKTWSGLSYSISTSTNWINFVTVPNGINLIKAKFYGEFDNDLFEIAAEESHIDSQTGILESWFRLQGARTVKVITLQYTKTTDAPGTGPTPGNIIYLPSLYSEEEREVGVWTDGKPLYQKTIHFSSPVTVAKYGTSGTTITTITNIEQIVSSVYSTFQNGSSNEEKSLMFWIENDDIKASDMFSHQYYSGQFTDFTFQYTKTTDQPGSGTWTPDGEYAHHYSNTEKVVGTWIDGSTVYEKTFTGFSVTLQSGVLKDTGINVSYISKVISFTALSDDYLATIPVSGYKINGTLQMIGYQNGNVIDKCIVRYTKT